MAKYVRKTPVDKQKWFLDRAIKVHGDKFDYSKVEYKNSNEKVLIGCREHGFFSVLPYSHTNGSGCNKCARIEGGKLKTKSKDDFIKDCVEVHGSTYNYSLVKYKKSSEKVDIICPNHGVFSQKANSHLMGHGCPKCSAESGGDLLRITLEDFIEKSRAVHGTRYSYENTKLINCNQNVEITCLIHGVYLQAPKHHMAGHGCAKCAFEDASLRNRKDLDKFVEECHAVHNFKYSYDKVVYVNSGEKVTITCSEHGDFDQSAGSHLSGRGCPKCNLQGGYKQHLPGILYVFKFENLVKVGITNKDAEYRRKYVNSSSGHDFNIVKTYYSEDGSVIHDTETIILNKLRKYHKSPTNSFDGFTECFYDVDISNLLTDIEKVLNGKGKEARVWASKFEATDGIAGL